MEKAVVILHFHQQKKQIDLEIPLDIAAKELVVALNEAYDLGIQPDNIAKSCLRSENPIALLKGDKTLREYGVHDGTIINLVT